MLLIINPVLRAFRYVTAMSVELHYIQLSIVHVFTDREKAIIITSPSNISGQCNYFVRRVQTSLSRQMSPIQTDCILFELIRILPVIDVETYYFAVRNQI